jgi:hypothetical protein
MSSDVVQAIAVTIVLGALIAAWAFLHFNEPYRQDTIRFSVRQQRYYIAVSAHLSVILGIYAILVLATYSLVLWTMYGNAMVTCWKCIWYRVSCDRICDELKPLELKPEGLIWAALISAVLVRIVVPNFPPTRYLIDRLRSLTHEYLALFPFARQSLVALIEVSNFNINKGSGAQIGEELARYGVASESISFLSPSAKHSLLEVCAVRRQLIELSDQSQAFRDLRSHHPRSVNQAVLAKRKEGRTLFDDRKFRRFGRARAEIFAQLETDFRHLVRRSARALLLAEDVGEHVRNDAMCHAISKFVAEESDHLLTRYRQLIVEAALSCVPNYQERAQFLKFVGYEAPFPPALSPALPIEPFVIVFVLDLLLFLIPTVLLIFIDTATPYPLAGLILFPLVHALSQTVAIGWAIYPKATSNFARPSLYSSRMHALPWQSYIMYGIGSYATGAIILLIFRVAIPMPFPIVFPTLLSSVSFFLMTVGMSILVDLRLLSRSLDFKQDRMRDGVVMALCMFAGTATFQVVMFYVAPRLGWLDPQFRPTPFIPVRLSYLVLSATLGFVVGYFVPATAAAYLQKARLWAHQLDLSGLPTPLHRNEGLEAGTSVPLSPQI